MLPGFFLILPFPAISAKQCLNIRTLAGCDVQRFNTECFQPSPNRFRYELRLVIAADIVRTAGNRKLTGLFNDIAEVLGFHRQP